MGMGNWVLCKKCNVKMQSSILQDMMWKQLAKCKLTASCCTASHTLMVHLNDLIVKVLTINCYFALLCFWHSVNIFADDIIKRKLLIEGDGGNDDRRINSLLKTFIKWCQSSESTEERFACFFLKIVLSLLLWSSSNWTSFSPLGGDIFRSHQMRGQESNVRLDESFLEM